MSETVVTPRLSGRRRFSEESQTTCILCNKPCDEDKSGFPLDAWNRMRKKANKWQAKDKIWVSHVGVQS